MKKKITLFLLLATAVVGRAQTTTELLPVGTEAPDFQITNDKTGEKIFRLSDWKTKTDADGKVVPGVWTVLDFWASWCPDCRKDMPKVKEISKKYLTKIQLVGISFDTDKEKMNKYLSSNHYDQWMQYCEGKKWKETQISKDYHIDTGIDDCISNMLADRKRKDKEKEMKIIDEYFGHYQPPL